jgi:hypothetical protein
VSETTNEYMTFEEWMAAVDQAVRAVTGLRAEDFPDFGFRFNFDDGLSAEETADELVAEEWA